MVLGKRRTASAVTRTLSRVAITGTVLVTPIAFSAAPAQAASHTNWDAVAKCESSGNWHANTGNGYYGGLQFNMRTWRSHGGRGQPQNASRDYQIQIAEKVKQTQGMSAWPKCGKRG
jgi:hypothetical protein